MTNQQVLLLDVGFRPIARTPWQQAIVHLLDHVAEVVDGYPDQKLGTINPIEHPGLDLSVLMPRQKLDGRWEVNMPSVIRLLKPVPRKKAIKFSRSNVWLRDGGKCGYCGIKVRRDDFTYDHVIPRRLGGKTEWLNVVCSCVGCNQRKGGRTPEQAGMKLRVQPVRPKKLPDATNFAMPWRDGMPPSWRTWLRDVTYWEGTLDES